MNKLSKPKLDEKRDLHPLVQKELEGNGYMVEHEARIGRKRVDFVARLDRGGDAEIIVVEVKRDCKSLAEACGQVRNYARQLPGARPMLAIPDYEINTEAEEMCHHEDIWLMAIHVPHNVLALAARYAPVEDDRPLPLLVAERWGFTLQHISTEYHYIFSLHDWVRGLTGLGADALRMQVKRLLSDPTITFNVTVEKYLAPNGKTYKVPFVSDRNLYDVAQALRPLSSREKLPQVHREILNYLAKAGVLVDTYRRNPERMRRDAEQLIAQRGETIDESYVRKELTDAINELTGGKCGLYIAEFTNIINEGVLQKTASQQRSALDLVRTKNPRDHMYPPGRMLIAIAEYMAADELRKRQPATLDEIRDVLRTTAAAVGLGAQVIQSGTDTDLVTGRALPPYRVLEDET